MQALLVRASLCIRLRAAVKKNTPFRQILYFSNPITFFSIHPRVLRVPLKFKKWIRGQ